MTLSVANACQTHLTILGALRCRRRAGPGPGGKRQHPESARIRLTALAERDMMLQFLCAAQTAWAAWSRMFAACARPGAIPAVATTKVQQEELPAKPEGAQECDTQTVFFL